MRMVAGADCVRCRAGCNCLGLSNGSVHKRERERDCDTLAGVITLVVEHRATSSEVKGVPAIPFLSVPADS